MGQGLWSRLREITRASPGELGLITLLAAVVIGGSALVYARTADPPAPPTKRVAPETVEAKESKKLLIHVAGMVSAPGVYELIDGSRVKDAIAAAGGASEGADPNALNLAALLSDGQRIVVPKIGEAVAAESSAVAGAKVNLNTATKVELETLPSVGPVLAQRILDYRQQKGRFRSVRQIMEIDGFGPKKFESLKDLIAV
ncbi:MAG: helix-hairpin-helix domain-containing protein [Actinomycetota bacterium]